MPVQEVRLIDQIVFANDAARKSEAGVGVGSSISSMLSEGFMKAKSVFGGMANSVQTTVDQTYDHQPQRQAPPMSNKNDRHFESEHMQRQQQMHP